VQEVVRYLAEEGLITQQEGRWRPAKDTPLEMNIPEGLRDVIGKRLSLLSKECNQLLSIASGIGREFALETLKAVVKIDEEAFVNALKQAVQLSVLEERSQLGVVRYRFTHAFFRQTLYEEMIAPQRLKLHQQVARALEIQYAKRLDEHAAELAEHFSHSTDPADLKKAVEYGELAAKRAMEVYAYGEAARLLDQAIKVQKVLNPDDKSKQCDLLLALCNALRFIPDTRRVIEIEAPAALSLAESIGDESRAARACLGALSAIVVEQSAQGLATPEAALWAERADQYAKPDTAERVLADGVLGHVKCMKGDMTKGLKLLTQALDLARRLGDPSVISSCGQSILVLRRAPQHVLENIRLVEELLTNIIAMPSIPAASLLFFIGNNFLTVGQRQRAEEAWGELRAIAERTGPLRIQLLSSSADAHMAVMDGRFQDALAIVEKIRTRGKEAGITVSANVFSNAAEFRTRIYLGISLEALERMIVDEDSEWNRPVLRCLGSAHLGLKKEASDILEKYVIRRPNIGTLEDEERLWVDTPFLEAAVIVKHRPAADLLLKRLNVPGLYTTGFSYPTCVPRHLGGAAALLERYDEARKHYMEAIKVCTEMPFRPELALSRLQLAELLLEHYPAEKKEALEHLDFAIKEFREMKMQPSLERALKHKEILKA
jgi:tetratricopeptide (TPR) repeat protein